MSDRLLLRESAHVIRNDVLQWIKDFLADREQVVVVEDQHFSPADVSSGVPQGSVIGPFLFYLYIYDLPKNVKHSSTRLFANDSMMSRTIRSENDASLLQKDLNKLQQWEIKWTMGFNTINVKKCQ